ncbi:MAG: K(+)-transporting ATPase subunit F [Phycisphaeraceae bacterium]|nr:K(+)-transporting ATPase subunit F [Phycisphaeraceae bacterium]
MNTFILVIAGLCVGYLFYAMLRPERF